MVLTRLIITVIKWFSLIESKIYFQILRSSLNADELKVPSPKNCYPTTSFSTAFLLMFPSFDFPIYNVSSKHKLHIFSSCSRHSSSISIWLNPAFYTSQRRPYLSFFTIFLAFLINIAFNSLNTQQR